MSYVVLARKYRPMRFADMVGQEHIGRTLGNAIKQDRVHHAYLFSGARGLGKTTTARIFAKGLVCVEGPTPDPCNVCSECVAVSEGRSVDVMEIDGASNNSVDDIRNLREQVNYLPQTARRKVYIIDEVHMLSTSAFNALLKTLEEPPPHVSFVFATTEPQKVLPTILSRVNRLDFKRVAPGELVAYLQQILVSEGVSVEDGGLRIVARAGEGSVRDSLTLLDQVIAFSEDSTHVTEDEVRRLLGQADASALHGLVAAILDGDPTATMQRFDALVIAGNDLSVLSLQVLELLRDVTVLRVCGTGEVLPDATEAELAQLRALGNKVEPTTLGQLFDRFSRVIDRLPQSRSQRLLVEMGLLELACAEPVLPLGDLVDQLHALGRGVAPSGGGGRGGGGAMPRSGGAAPRGRGGPPNPTRRAEPSFEAPSFEAPSFEAPPFEAPSFEAPSFEARRGGFDPEPPPYEEPRPEPRPEPRSELRVAAPESQPARPPSPEPSRPEPLAAAPAPAAPEPEISPFMAKWLDKGLQDGIVASEEELAAERRPPSTPPAAVPPTSTARTPDRTPDRSAPALSVVREVEPAAPEIRMGVGPCLPSPPADGVIPWEELEPIEAWERLVNRMGEADEFIAAVLGEVGLVSLADGVLRVAAPRGSFAHTKITREPEVRAQVEQATRDHLGAPFTLELIEGDPGPDLQSLDYVYKQRRAQHRAQVEAEAKEHPGIQALLRTFDAQLLGTKPLHEA